MSAPTTTARPRCTAICAHGRQCSNRSVENVVPSLCGNHHRQDDREIEAAHDDYETEMHEQQIERGPT